MPCGTPSSYNHGCRCDECRRAAADRKSQIRQRVDPQAEWHPCDECTRAFKTQMGLASHIGRAHRAGKSRPDHVARLFLAGIALPLVRSEGEQLPCDGLLELFYPDPRQVKEYRRKIEAAKSLCRSCPRQVECRDGAMQRQEPAGVWGGVAMETLFAPHLRRPARGETVTARTA